ncbi:small membrane protein MtfM [Actinorhabdospora filicis]|nr:small membrane protein MtfM [Actinorhabdospora filicis]
MIGILTVAVLVAAFGALAGGLGYLAVRTWRRPW